MQRQRIATVFGKWGVQEGGVHEKHLNGVWMPVFFLNRREKGRVKRPFRLKVKKVEKTTRPFRYDLNQIPYDYTVEVRKRFKGLDLIDRCYTEPKRSMNLEGNSKKLVSRIVSFWLVTVNAVASLH